MTRSILLALLVSAACAGQNTDVAPALSTTSAIVGAHTATNPAAAFDRYRTFSFGPSEGAPSGYELSPRATDVQRRLRPLIAAALTERGYTAVPDGGDMVLMIGWGRREVTTHEVSSVGTGWLPDDENQDFVEGGLVIDAFDARDGERIWHGAATASTDSDRIDDQQLLRSVHTLVTSFPRAPAE